MNADDLRDQQIENYIHNRMNEEDRLQFEKQLQSDLELKKEVNELLEMKTVFDKGLIDYKKKLSSVEEELEKEIFFEEPKIIPIRNNTRVWWAIAASVILIAGIFYFYNTKPDLKQLAMDAAKNDFPLTRGTTLQLDSLLKQEKYNEVIETASLKIDSATSGEEKANLNVYIARVYILTGKAQAAIDLMESVQQTCDARYTLALAYLCRGETEKAKNILKGFAGGECYDLEKPAEKLLKKL